MKVISGVLNIGILMQSVVLSPATFAKTSRPAVGPQAKSSVISDAEILQRYAMALKSKNVEQGLAEVTEQLLASGLSEARIASAIKRTLMKADPEAYAEINEKVQALSATEGLSQQEKLLQMREITTSALLRANSTGLAFRGSCSESGKIVAYVLAGVAIIGGIVALSINTSEVKIKKTYDNNRQKRQKDYINEVNFINNAEAILLQRNNSLVNQIDNKYEDISVYGNDIVYADSKIAQANLEFQIAAEQGILLSDQRIQELKDEKVYWENEKNKAYNNIESAEDTISDLTNQIQANALTIIYYSNPANVDYELSVSKFRLDNDILNLEQDYQNDLASVPAQRQAAGWTGIGAAVALGASAVVFAVSNSGCNDH